MKSKLLCQIYRVPDKMEFEDNSQIIFLISKTTYFGPSLEASWSDSSNKGSQHTSLSRNRKNYP